MKRLSFIFYLMIIVPFACSSNNKMPSNIIPPDEMKFIVWDMMKAGELAAFDTIKNKNISYKTISLNLYQKVFIVHHINKNNFYESYKYYLQHPDINAALMDSVTAVGSREKAKQYMHRIDAL